MWTLTRLLSWRYLIRRTLRMLLATLSIALGVATLIASQVLSRSTFAAVENRSGQLAGQADLQIANGELGVELDLLPAIRSVSGVRAAVPLLMERVTVSVPNGKKQKVLLLGIDRDNDELVRDYGTVVRQQIDPSFLTDVQFLTQGGPVAAAGEGLHKALPSGTRFVHVHTPRGLQRVWIGGTLKLEGAGAALGGHLLVMELPKAIDLLGGSSRGKRVTRIDVLLDTDASGHDVEQALQSALGDKAAVHPPRVRDTGLEDVLGGIQVSLTVGATVALLVGLFLVYNSLAVTVAERRHDIGILRALGGTRGQVRLLFAIEALILGVIGSALGVVGGIALARFSLGTVEQVLQQQFAGVDVRELAVTPGVLVIGMLAGVLASLAASLAPASAAAAEPPSHALRRVPIRLRRWRFGWPLGAALLALATAGTFYRYRGHFADRSATLICIYLVGIGFMLITPLLARLGVMLLQPLARIALGIAGRLAADDLARSPSRTGLTVGALALGLAMTIGTAGMIVSSEVPLFAWMDRAIRAELFVTSGSAITSGGDHQPMDEQLGDELAAIPGVQDIVQLRMVHLEYGATRVLLYALPIRTYTKHGVLSVSAGDPEAWQQLIQPGRNILVSDNFITQQDVQVGDEIELPTPRGRTRWRIVGTIPEYSWNRGTIIMDRQQYKEFFLDSFVDSFDLYLKPEADPQQVRAAIDDRLGGTHDLVILTNAEFRQHVKGMLDQFYVLFYANGFMALAVSFLGVVNTLAISVLHRRREIGMLRAVGATRAQVAWSVTVQAVLIGILGAILGVGLGALLQLFALRVVMIEEAGFVFAFLFPTTATLIAIAFTLAAAQIAGAIPASRAAWQPISDAVAYE